MLANQFAKHMAQSAKTASIFARNDDFGRGAAASSIGCSSSMSPPSASIHA